jgi:hypothetical protein
LRIVIIASKESGEMETKIGTNMESYVVNYNNISLQEFKSCPFNSFSESNYHFPLPFWLENRSNKRKMLPNSSKCQRKLSQGLSQKKISMDYLNFSQESTIGKSAYLFLFAFYWYIFCFS